MTPYCNKALVLKGNNNEKERGLRIYEKLDDETIRYIMTIGSVSLYKEGKIVFWLLLMEDCFII